MTFDPNAPPSVPMPKLTDEQARALADYMIGHGKARARAQGAEFNEVDFLAGCMASYFAFGAQDKIPASWIFGPLGNVSPLALPDRERSVWVVYDAKSKTADEAVTVYRDREPAAEHVDYLMDNGNDEAYLMRENVRHELRDYIADSIELEEVDA